MMSRHGGFEGNAQTLRIVSQLEKKVIKPGDESAIERRCGLNLTYRQLAAVLKYDRKIPKSRTERKRPVKGYYFEDAPIVEDIKKAITENSHGTANFKTVECAIMDLADDIAYSTYDLEDSFKAGFLTPYKVLTAPQDVFRRVAEKVSGETQTKFEDVDVFDVFMEMFSAHIDDERYIEDYDREYSYPAKLANAVFMTSEIDVLAEDSRQRTDFTSSLVGEFVDAVDFELNSDFPALSKVVVPINVRQKIETLKRFTYEATIRSSRLRLAEFRGYEIVKQIFSALTQSGGETLLPDDQMELWGSAQDEQQRMRVISDFIAGMTDRYALEFHGRLYSDNPVSMFKTA